ncbi:caspase family protein [Cyanobacteria bacterium FACHB-DQ100]|nr:caspase family protein [Cyanobacteria bacterium FACHB-DQ100]
MQSTLKTGQAKLWILLIGVSRYEDRKFPILQYSTIDTQSLADAFVDVTQEFPNTSIQVHHDAAAAPSLSEVKVSLQTITEQAKPEDTVVVYFCGHAALDLRLQQAVFCLADTQKDAMRQTGLSAIGLLGLLGNCAAKQQVLWIDVWHANGMTAQTDAAELLDNPVGQLIQMLQQQAMQHPGFQALLSCNASGREIQQSWKFPELGHGVFAHFLIEGLRGAAANAEGTVTTSVLGNYVHDRTVDYVDRSNQQIEWLHRDTKNRSSKAILQTPVRIGQAQTVLGIKPKDPLELLFPEIEAPNIDPPLPRSTQPYQPQLETETIVPPSIEKPSTIEPEIPIVQKIVSEPSAAEPVEPAIPSAIEPTIPTIQTIALDQTAISPVAEWVKPEITPVTSFPTIASNPVESATIKSLVKSPASKPVRKTGERQVRHLQEAARQHFNQAGTTLTSLQGAIVQATQAAGEFAIAQQTQSKQRAAQLKSAVTTKISALNRSISQAASSGQTLYQQRASEIGQIAVTTAQLSKQRAVQLKSAATTKISALNQSIFQTASSGQALYRQRSSEANQIAATTVQHLGRATRNLTQSTLEQTQKPKTQKMVTTGVKIVGVVAVAGVGVGLYQSRSEQIETIQNLSSAATTQLEANQAREALSTALEAGHKLQQVDRPWNFVPESLKISTIVTLQQAIAASEPPLSPLSNSLSSASLSPDQKTFAVVTRNNSIQLWQRAGNQPQSIRAELKGHKAAVTQIVFSPDGKRLASASQDKTIKLWNIEKGILIQTLSAHTEAVTALSFRSDGEVLASGSADQTIKLWNVSKGRILDTFKGHNATASVIRFSPDGRILAAGTLTNTLHLWYPDSQNPILLGTHGSRSEAQAINDLAFTPDGKTIASAGSDSTIKLWTAGKASSERETVPTQTLSGHEAAVTSISFIADGKVLASGGRDRTIRLWNMQDGTFLKTLLGSQDQIEQIALSSDSKTLLSVGNRYGLKIWDFDLETLMQTGCRLSGNRSACS